MRQIIGYILITFLIGIGIFFAAPEFKKSLDKDRAHKQEKQRTQFLKDSLQIEVYKKQLRQP